MLTFIAITLGSALALHIILFAITKLFGKGGKGMLGDIRTAIGSSLPTPLGIDVSRFNGNQHKKYCSDGSLHKQCSNRSECFAKRTKYKWK